MSMHREGNMLTWDTVDLAQMSFAEQLHAMRKTNVLVGVHGAGLMLVVFTAEESILLEIHPNYRQPSSPSLTSPAFVSSSDTSSRHPSSPPSSRTSCHFFLGEHTTKGNTKRQSSRRYHE